MPLVICCNLDLPDGSGMDFLDEVRAVQGDSFVVGMFQMKNPPVRFLLFRILPKFDVVAAKTGKVLYQNHIDPLCLCVLD